MSNEFYIHKLDGEVHPCDPYRRVSIIKVDIPDDEISNYIEDCIKEINRDR